MEQSHAWGEDLVAKVAGNTEVAFENFNGEIYEDQDPQLSGSAIAQGPLRRILPPFFKPANIVSEGGVYYVTLFVCEINNNNILQQQVAMWLGGLKDTDHIKLNVCATVTNIPYEWLVTLLAALANTKAQIEILLNSIVIDGLAYFYLLADQVTVSEGGALFIPSYVTHRAEDVGAPFRAAHDFYKWIVEDAVIKERLTSSEAELLFAGSHVVVPSDRF